VTLDLITLEPQREIRKLNVPSFSARTVFIVDIVDIGKMLRSLQGLLNNSEDETLYD
jgi:hypothetical protein